MWTDLLVFYVLRIVELNQPFFTYIKVQLCPPSMAKCITRASAKLCKISLIRFRKLLTVKKRHPAARAAGCRLTTGLLTQFLPEPDGLPLSGSIAAGRN